MKEIMFSKVKGKPSKQPVILYFHDENIQIEEKIITILCSSKIEFNNLSTFLRQYIFNTIDLDIEKLKIFIPKDYVAYCRNSSMKF